MIKSNKDLFQSEKALLFVAGLISDVISFILKHIVRYRVRLVTRNLEKAFPEKDDKQIQKIVAAYYHHLGDLCVEPVLFYLAPANLKRKLMNFEGIDLLDQLHAEGKNIILFASHQGNWEYLIDLPHYTRYRVASGYSPITNKFLDNFLFRLRSRSGVDLIPKHLFYRRSLALLQEKERLNMVVVIADQRPAPGSSKYYVPFFGLETGVQLGAERLGVKSGAAIIQVESVKTSRFRYTYRFEIIARNPANSPPLSITADYFTRLERSIRRSPSQWLWSHDRWKQPGSVSSERKKNGAPAVVNEVPDSHPGDSN